MEEYTEFTIRKPVRRRKSKMEVFKEAYLPYLILLLAAIVILTFIIGALVRNAKEKKAQQPDTAQAAIVEVVDL